MKGFESSDDFFLNSETYLTKLPFIAAYELRLDHFKASQFGLARSGSDPPVVLQELKKQGFIETMKVSFALHTTNHQSHFIIGEPDYRFTVQNSSYHVILPLTKSDNKYTFELKNVQFGAQPLYSEISDACVDISYPWVGIPALEFDRIVRFLTRNYGLYE